jgi:hypothetical protein
MSAGRQWPRGLILFLGLLGAAPAAPGDWRVSPREVRDEVKTVVGDQLRAFQREDFTAARALAAAAIQQQFRPAVYERMIRRGYAELVGHERAEVGIVRDDAQGLALVPVIVHVPGGKVARFRYHLLREEGAWRVTGVLPERAAPPGDT